MPFTPFHMGPALALKTVSGRYFSVLVFGIAQVAMDISALIQIIRGAEILHGPTHGFLGATLIGFVVLLIAPPLCRAILTRWNRELAQAGYGCWRSPEPLGLLPAATGALIGTYSHVLLDSVVHWDMAPFWPWTKANPFLESVSSPAVHLLCVLTGLFGVAIWFAAGLWRKAQQSKLSKN